MFQKTFSRLARGLVFHERDEWKKRRRIISNVFNYDFVASFSNQISSIFENVLIECEQKSLLADNTQIEFDVN